MPGVPAENGLARWNSSTGLPYALVGQRDAMDVLEFLRGECRAEVSVLLFEQVCRRGDPCFRGRVVARLAPQAVDDAVRTMIHHAPLEPFDLPGGQPELFPNPLAGNRAADQLGDGFKFKKFLLGEGDCFGHSGARFLHQL